MTTREIPAPDGFEARHRYPGVGRDWWAAFRRIGDEQWTLAFIDERPSSLTDDKLDSLAAAVVEHAIAARPAPED